jgi:stage II sporulation protein AA (anti-sigma F factor antagonist)
VARAGDVEVTVETLPDGGVVVVHVEGDLDMATSPDLEGALEAADPGTRIVVDLTECTFLDSSAVRVLVSAVRTAETTNGNVALVARDPGILRVLEIAAVDTMLPVHDTLESAL